MRFAMLLLVAVVLLSMFWQSEANKMCYKAKTCFHNGVEKCGVNRKGKPRRFLDSCDVWEYNCLKKTDYVVAKAKKCSKLPPIEDEPVPAEAKQKFV